MTRRVCCAAGREPGFPPRREGIPARQAARRGSTGCRGGSCLHSRIARTRWRQARWVHPSRKSAAFEVAAERPVAIWNGTVTPTLVVRCNKGRVDAFVFTRFEPNGVVQVNDNLDADTGANNLQNYPVIATANATTITGTFNSAANQQFLRNRSKPALKKLPSPNESQLPQQQQQSSLSSASGSSVDAQ